MQKSGCRNTTSPEVSSKAKEKRTLGIRSLPAILTERGLGAIGMAISKALRMVVQLDGKTLKGRRGMGYLSFR